MVITAYANTIVMLSGKGKSDPDVSILVLNGNGDVDWKDFSERNLKHRVFAKEFCMMPNHTSLLSRELSWIRNGKRPIEQNLLGIQLNRQLGDEKLETLL